MSKPLRVLQLNVRKGDAAHDSLMNDKDIDDAAVIAIQEPRAWKAKGRLFTSPMAHHKWTKMVPSITRELGRWPIRSMLWVRKDLEAEQVPISSSDVTAALVRLPGRQILFVSVYVEGEDAVALSETCELLQKAVRETRQRAGEVVDAVIVGDFNRHDQLWGGDNVSWLRQGEGDDIINLMNDLGLSSLLPRGTKTWQRGEYESTIDLVLASSDLATNIMKCAIVTTKHGSDHEAIETLFDVTVPEQQQRERLLFKNAPWKEINERIAKNLVGVPTEGTVQQQTDALMSVVNEAVHSLTPRAKPSPVAKRWWTEDLTQLRRIYTYWRSRARSTRRAGCRTIELENTARAAGKQYHCAIRQQKKKHWNEFLADNDNIWQVARYLRQEDGTAFGKVPQLVKKDGSRTLDEKEQAQELLATFFPPLPSNIEDEAVRPLLAAVPMPELTLEEVERQLNNAKSWKAPGDDGLPTIVWKQIWPVVKDRVLALFQHSLREGTLPHQWLHAKIIPLKKPGKEDYTVPKAWRPISLLATLGKILESVVAERLSYAAETYGLLPTNHFGGRKKRSAEQALMTLQEYIYAAWRRKHVVSAISFDVKGAYNGVYRERLLQRLRARRIPEWLVRWIGAFCSNRTATIQVNRYNSEVVSLPQAGLSQGSPLSLVLFSFFNADLVQRQIDANGGAIAFVDDYTAWVTSPTAQLNRARLQVIADSAMEWERKSGATFEAEKTALIHFTKNSSKLRMDPIIVKGEEIYPRDHAKILGVLMDNRLKYKQHIARAASRGLEAALELTRFKGLSTSSARQLFNATVAPVVDYASNVWMHACKDKNIGPINRVQRVGAQAIIGSFATVATSIAESEASLQTVKERFWKRAIKLWIDIHTLPKTNPLHRMTSRVRKFYRSYRSPFHQVARSLKDVPLEKIETIQSFTLAPWDKRVQAIKHDDKIKETQSSWDVCVAVGSSARNDVVGAGGVVCATTHGDAPATNDTFSFTLGSRSEQNPYSAELAAMAHALNVMPYVSHCRVALLTTSQAAALTLRNPRQHSGQEYVRRIYSSLNKLWKNGNGVLVFWIPSSSKNELLQLAKKEARRATKEGSIPKIQASKMKSTTLNSQKKKLKAERSLPDDVGKHTKRVDAALPGGHTRQLYDDRPWKERNVLSQMRTDMNRLNSSLYRIKATASPQCDCGYERETVAHFLFRCPRWDAQRRDMFECTETQRGNISFFLGGKAPADGPNWKPNMKAVQAAIRFALATGRLENTHHTQIATPTNH